MGQEYDGMRSIEARMAALEENHRMLQNQFNGLKGSLEENTGALNEFIELGKALKFGLKFLGGVEKACVFIAKVAAALGIIIACWRYAVTQAIANSLK